MCASRDGCGFGIPESARILSRSRGFFIFAGTPQLYGNPVDGTQKKYGTPVRSSAIVFRYPSAHFALHGLLQRFFIIHQEFVMCLQTYLLVNILLINTCSDASCIGTSVHCWKPPHTVFFVVLHGHFCMSHFKGCFSFLGA